MSILYLLLYSYMHVFTFIISILLNTCMCTFPNHYSSTYHGNNSIKSFIYNKQIHQTRPSLNFFFHFLIQPYLFFLAINQ